MLSGASGIRPRPRPLVIVSGALLILALLLIVAALLHRYTGFRFRSGPAATGFVSGRVTFVSEDGSSLCIRAASGRVTCAIPRLDPAASLPSRGDNVKAFFALFPVDAEANLRTVAWLTFFP